MKNNNLKVLIVCPFFYPNVGGVETHLQLLTNYLLKKGCLINVLTYRPLVTKVKSYKDFEKKGRMSIRRLWWFNGVFFDKTTPYPLLQFLYVVPGLLIYSLYWMFKYREKVDVIHAHGFAASFIIRVVTLFFPKYRKVASIHFVYRRLDTINLYTKVFKWVYMGFDKIFLTCKMSEKEFLSIGIPKEKLILTKLWIDQKEFHLYNKNICREKIGINNKAKMVVLFIGRIIKMKGVFNLLQAARVLPEEIMILLVGGGPDANSLKSQSMGVKNFSYVGRIPDELISYYYGACDLLVLPSLTDEAQPMVVMEALSYGRPVIVTNKGGAKDLINESVGVVINPSVNNLKKTFINLYNNPTKIKQMQERSRDFALGNFDDRNADVVYNNYLND